jgi:hypothetical protein
VSRKPTLFSSMTLREFENGYWYATELKDFGETLGIPSAAKLRKDELEKAIRGYLVTGKLELPTKRALSKSGVKDVERGLRLSLPVVLYTSNRATKDFLQREALKISPGMKRRSGVRYRLNRWREEQLVACVRLTYGDLVKKYVELSESRTPFARIPHGRYINFMSDFLSAEKGATRAQAIAAWKKLKALDVPKSYASWVQLLRRRSFDQK